MYVEGLSTIMTKGTSVHIPPLTKHFFGGLKNSDIIEISTKHYEDDSYRLDSSCKFDREKFLC